MKQFVLSFFCTLLILGIGVPILYSATRDESVQIEKKEVLYQLPYPGLLPGHPLYFLKSFRDNILIFTTRDNLKKAKLYLLLSDKNMSIAQALIEDGKEKLAISQLQQGEKRFLLIPPLLSNLKKQGGEYSNDFIISLDLSNQKHREVIADVMGQATESEIAVLNSLLEMNSQAATLLQGIK